jgi:hypothetical protein
MNIDRSKFLAFSIALASATALAAGCTVVNSNTKPAADAGPVDPGPDGSLPVDASMASDSGLVTDSSVSNDSGRTDGGASDAMNTDAGPACLGDVAPAGAGPICAVTNPAGCMGSPDGVEACTTGTKNFRDGVAREFAKCLNAAESCPTSSSDSVYACVLQATGKACEVPAARAACIEVYKNPDCMGPQEFPLPTIDECTSQASALSPANFTALKACFAESTTCGTSCFTAAFFTPVP